MEVVIFTTKECNPCRSVKAILADIQDQQKFRMRIVEASRETFREFERYGIRSAPTVICLDEEGNKVGDFSGAISKDMIEQYLKVWGVTK